MGDKLVKMVRVLFILISLIAVDVSAIPVDQVIENKSLYKLHVDPLAEKARIYKIVGDGNSFQLNQSYIGKPLKRDLKKTNLVTKRDRYILKFTDSDNNVLMRLGIGDPFTAYAQHIGYEDRLYMGGPVSSAKIEIAIPIHIEPTSFIISKRDMTGKFKDIQEISIQ